MNDDPAHYGEMVARVITAESIAADRLERSKLKSGTPSSSSSSTSSSSSSFLLTTTKGEQAEKSLGRAGGTNYRLVIEVRWVASGQSDRHEVLVHVSPNGEFTLEADTIIRERNSPMKRTLP